MLQKLFPHAAIILSGMYIVFFCIDRVNSAMRFIDNDITKVLLLCLCAVSIVNACLIIGADRRKERSRMKQKRGAQYLQRSEKRR